MLQDVSVEPGYDVFLSYAHSDADRVKPILVAGESGALVRTSASATR